MKPRYLVKYCRSDGWWAINIPGVPGAHSQCRRLADIVHNAREAIALVLDVEPDTFDLDLLYCEPGRF